MCSDWFSTGVVHCDGVKRCENKVFYNADFQFLFKDEC